MVGAFKRYIRFYWDTAVARTVETYKEEKIKEDIQADILVFSVAQLAF